jgi:hypothetical protein
MVLLDNCTNSSLSNHPFRKKRERIVEKVEQEGSFRPSHLHISAVHAPDDQLQVWSTIWYCTRTILSPSAVNLIAYLTASND